MFLKADRFTKMHDHELAFKALYKSQRVLRAMDPIDQALMARFYELMAAANITQKELMTAHDYLLKARKIHLNLGKAEHTKQLKRK